MAKKLGASDAGFWLSLAIIGQVVLFVVIFAQMLIASLFKVEPFEAFDKNTTALFAFLAALVQNGICLLIGVIIEA